MKQFHIIGALVGLLLGGVVGVLLRPSLPMFGQPPIDVAFGSFGISCAASPMDCAYAGQFGQMLLAVCLVGTILGFGIAFLFERTRAP